MRHCGCVCVCFMLILMFCSFACKYMNKKVGGSLFCQNNVHKWNWRIWPRKKSRQWGDCAEPGGRCSCREQQASDCKASGERSWEASDDYALCLLIDYDRHIWRWMWIKSRARRSVTVSCPRSMNEQLNTSWRRTTPLSTDRNHFCSDFQIIQVLFTGLCSSSPFSKGLISCLFNFHYFTCEF